MNFVLQDVSEAAVQLAVGWRSDPQKPLFHGFGLAERPAAVSYLKLTALGINTDYQINTSSGVKENNDSCTVSF